MHQSEHTDSFPKDHGRGHADGATGRADDVEDAPAMTAEPVSDMDKHIARSIREREAFRHLAAQRESPQIHRVTSLTPFDDAHGS